MDPIFAAAIFFLFVLGAVVGSFLNVVIYRLPRGESVLGETPSHCTRCGRRLGAGDLVPLLSWLVLRGRCRSCGTRISSRYFGIELLTGFLFAGVFLALPFVPAPGEPHLAYNLLRLAHNLMLVCLFIPMIFIDQDLQIVPDELSVPLFLIGLSWNVVEGLTGHPWLVTLNTNGAAPLYQLSLPTSLVFATICAGIFSLIRWFGEIAFQKEAMGLGDVFIVAGIGANFPLLDALCSFAIAITVGAVYGSILIATGRRDKGSQMAFGPMLLLGALVMMLMQSPVEHWVQAYRATLGVG